MKKLLSIVFILLTSTVFAQDANVEIIKEFSKKMQELQSVNTSFSFTLENIQEKISDSHQGKLIFKDKKYVLELMGMETYFDGKTKWQYIKEANEVTVSLPQGEEGTFLDDPTALFKNYDKNYKSKFRKEFKQKNKTICEFDFFPNNLDLPYSSIRLQIEKESLEPVMFRYQGKDGNNYIIKIKNFKMNQQIKDEKFTFDPSKHKDIDVVDLRE